MKASTVTDILYKNLNFRAQRQKVIAGNIANINTPNYKTKELSFDNILKKSTSGDLKLSITNKNHIPFEIEKINNEKYNMYEVQGITEQNDGNNVNLDTQMGNMAKNTMLFNAIQGSIKKDSLWLKEVIRTSGRS
jgi:flagellar basal-body rod protein FlgB